MARTRQFIMCLTEEEYNRLVLLAEADEETKTKKSKVANVSAYVRKQIFQSDPKGMELRKQVKNLSYMFRQLVTCSQQIAMRTNAGISIDFELERMNRLLEQVSKQLYELLEEMKKDGNHQD